MFNVKELLAAEQLSIIIITLVMGISIVVLGNRVKKLEVTDNPKGFVQLGILYVETLNNMVMDNIGEKHGKKFSAYLGSVFLYILIANISGLFGLETPTSSFSVTLVLSLITFILIQATSISQNGVKGYIKGFFDPIFPFVIPNFFGAVAPLISLSMRLFGNVLSGGIIMGMLYSFTAWLSSFFPLIGGFNFMGVILAPILHLYFDLFAGFLQAFIFLTLTSILISVEFTD